jgi:putative DNA primase/helicase
VIYQEGKWERLKVEQLFPQMRNVIKEYIDEGTKEADAWVKRSLDATQMRRSFEHAQGTLTRSASDFDAQPYLLNFADGTLDLRPDGDGFREHRSSDRLTQKLEVPFEGEHLDLWEETVESILPDPETRRYFQKVMGYLLSGEPDEDLVFLVHGATRTGKGTLLGAIEKALGDYGEKLSLTALLQSRYEDARSASPHIAKLRGKRAAFVSEIKPNARFDAETLKTFSGRDTITARYLHQNEETWVPQFSVVLVGNDRPKLPEDDDAVWERLREIPFKVSFAANPDPEIRKTLHDPEQAGTTILQWMYEGLQLYYTEGLRQIPPKVAEATRANREEMNPLRDWLAETSPEHPTRKEYVEWCDDQKTKPVGRNRFCKAVQQLGYEQDVSQKWIKP